jgi:ADP-heptose:LPS heptosyltransferase
VLVLRPGALGDTLLAVPALRALRRAFSPMTLAAHRGAARLLASLSEVDEGLAFDDPSLAWLFTDSIPSDDFIVAWMDAHNASALKHALVVAPSRPAGETQHAARYLLNTLSPLGIDVAWDDAPFNVTPIVAEEVLIHPGSGSPAKNWPAPHFAQVIRKLQADVRLVVGEADYAAAADVEATVGHSLPRLQLPHLDDLARRLAGCQGYLGNDSGVSHLAGLCGAHTVAIFGPTHPTVWAPIGPDVHVLPFSADPREVARALDERS